MLQTIVQDSGDSPDCAVIWLHGLGADGSDFVTAVPYLQLAEDLNVRFVFPSAPVRSVTINNGMQMSSWYDIKEMLPERVIDQGQLAISTEQIIKIIEDLASQGIAQSKVVVVGFSQGGAVAYELGLSGRTSIAGIAAMSTYAPNRLQSSECKADRELSILTIHGEHDDVVPYAMAEASVEYLQGLGFSPVWHSFAMAHEVSLESLEILGRWVTKQLTSK